MLDSPIPSSEDQFNYLLLLYFGRDADQLSCCIDRAYRDLNRTLHGFANVTDGKGLRSEASKAVRLFLAGLVDSRSPCLDQSSFDDRHRTACNKLCSVYSTAGFAKFQIGQAQKWINMALKYVFVFGEKHLPGYGNVFSFAHIPIDNIILGHLYKRGLPRLTTAWSRISSYQDYMFVQNWVRSTYRDNPPLAVEFDLFMKPA